MKPIVKQLLLWIVVIGIALGVRTWVSHGLDAPKSVPVSYADMLNQARNGQVRDVLIDGNTVTGHLANNDPFRTTKPENDPEMYTIFRANHVNITEKDQNSNVWINTLVSIVPFVLLLGLGILVLFLIVRRSREAHPKGV